MTNLVATIDLPFGKYNDAAFTIDIYHLRRTVWITRVINVPGQAAR